MKKLKRYFGNPAGLGRGGFIWSLVLVAVFILPNVYCQEVVEDIVVPGTLGAVEGNSRLTDPLSFGGVGSGVLRMQQVYAASEFLSSDVSLGGWVRALSFRADQSVIVGGYGIQIPNIQVWLSTTTKNPDGLSPIFSENIGDDNTLGRSGPIRLSAFSVGFDPERFDAYIELSTPFFYDPTVGNLLLEVITIDAPQFTWLDAVDVVGDGVSRVANWGSGTQAPTSGNVDTIGLVTSFSIMPVPEPSTWALLGLAAVIFGGRFCHTLSRRKAHHVTH